VTGQRSNQLNYVPTTTTRNPVVDGLCIDAIRASVTLALDLFEARLVQYNVAAAHLQLTRVVFSFLPSAFSTTTGVDCYRVEPDYGTVAFTSLE